ncbi:hypothetical protein Q3G72_020942 [Acer saccharum]|nr:hypothetical protein Q3G72_020942 [Acer saccharum]
MMVPHRDPHLWGGDGFQFGGDRAGMGIDNKTRNGATDAKLQQILQIHWFFYHSSLQEGRHLDHPRSVKIISQEQVAALKSPLAPEYKDNARPEQPLNFRKIELYHET